MLETDACVTESEAGLTDTAEPAAAGGRERKTESECVVTITFRFYVI